MTCMLVLDTEPADVPATGVEALHVKAVRRRTKVGSILDQVNDLRVCSGYGYGTRSRGVGAYVISIMKLKVDAPSTQELPKGTYFRLIGQHKASYSTDRIHDPSDLAMLGDQMVFEALDPSDPTRRLRVTQWQGLAGDTFDVVENAMTVVALAATGL